MRPPEAHRTSGPEGLVRFRGPKRRLLTTHGRHWGSGSLLGPLVLLLCSLSDALPNRGSRASQTGSRSQRATAYQTQVGLFWVGLIGGCLNFVLVDEQNIVTKWNYNWFPGLISVACYTMF